MLILLREATAPGASATSAKVVVPNSPQILSRGIPAQQYFANGAFPSAPDIRETADFMNMLLARRPRVLWSHYCKTWYSTASSTDSSTLRFACHTGPLAGKVRVVTVGYPASSRATSDSYLYWVRETELTGTGTSTTGDSVYASGIYSAHGADNFYALTQEFEVDPDEDYRFTLHQINACAVVSVVVYEVPRPVLDTALDSPIVDTTRIAHLAPITGGSVPPGTASELLQASDKLWRRGGHQLAYWSADGATALAKTNSSAQNALDATTTPATGTMGWPVTVTYSGSLDSANVGVVFWVCAYVSNALATGTVTLRDQANNVIATVSVTATTATWYSATGNLTDGSGATPTTRLEVYAVVTNTYTLSLHAFGAFMYTA